MSKSAIFTMKLEADLRAAFMAEAEASHRPASQVVRELMRDFIQRQQQARRDHGDFLQRKVDKARASAQEDKGRSNEAVDADFAARRSRLLDQA